MYQGQLGLLLLFSRSVWTFVHAIQSSTMSDSLWPHRLQHFRLSCPSPSPRACSNSCLLSQWCHPTISSSVIPFSHAFNLFQHQGFFQCYVWMWELDLKEGWALKNWYFWTVVLEKTLESSLDYKEIKPVSLKGNQSWIFIGKTEAETEAPTLWPSDVKSWLIGKDPDAGKDWR